MGIRKGCYPWTSESEARVVEMWYQGHSSSQIAVDIGASSRNTIIGKLHRLGLTGYGQPSITKPRTKHRRPSPPNSNLTPTQRASGRGHGRGGGVAAKILRQRIPIVPAYEPALHEDEPVSLDLQLIALTNRTCKWAHGDVAPFLFCGHPTFDSSYCPHHDHRSRGRNAPYYTPEQRALMRERYVRREHAGGVPITRISPVLETDAFVK